MQIYITQLVESIAFHWNIFLSIQVIIKSEAARMFSWFTGNENILDYLNNLDKIP